MLKKRRLTTDELIDGQLKAKKEAKEYEERTQHIRMSSDHVRLVELKVKKNITGGGKEGYVKREHLRKPSSELVTQAKQAGTLAKWFIKNDFTEHYQRILTNCIEDHIKEQDMVLVDITFRDIVIANDQYYVALARCLDFKHFAKDYDLPELNYTEEQKKEIIKKVVDNIEKEWQINPVK